jgi:hypothetical protein
VPLARTFGSGAEQQAMAVRETAPGEAPWTPVPLRSGLGAALAGPLGVAGAVYALLLLAGAKLLNDPDTYWHIAAGRWIWATRAVPSVDPFSHTLAGAPWHAHEWLAELILAGAYGAAGWAGVVALAAAAVAASLGLLMRALQRCLAPTAALAAVALTFYLAAAHLTARPHALALPLLVAWSVSLLHARDDNRAPSLWLLPLMTLWANLHGGFVAGLALAGFFAVEAVLSAADPPARRTALGGWGRFLAGAAIASLLTPQGIQGWLFPFRLMSLGFSLGFVSEWHAPDFTTLQPLEPWLLAVLAVTLGLGVRVPWTRLLLLLGLIYLALSHARDAELLALLAPLLLAAPLGEALGKVVPSRGGTSRGQALVLGLVMALMTAAAVITGYRHEDRRIAPAAALAAAEGAGLTGPVLNDYDFGGYLIFEGRAPFVDGRVDLYGDEFMRAYAAALDAKGDALPRLLDRYGVAWTLLQPGTRAAAALDRLPGWERVYADASAVVHRRR